MAGLKTPTHLRDAIIEAEIRQQRQDFIDSLRPDDILRLAASYHASGSEGVFFREPARGSYNMCYFVEFPPSDETTGVAPDRWVVRVPLDPYLASGPRDKLESEMATMMLLSEKTTIPVPRVIAYATGDTSKSVPNFAIIEYLEGRRLNPIELRGLPPLQKERLHASLADLFMQLRRLEFDRIGRIIRRPDGSYEVARPPASIDINAQALEGLEPFEVMKRYSGSQEGPGPGPLGSARDYLDMLLDLADNAFARSRGSLLQGDDREPAPVYLYYMHSFRRFANEWYARTAGADDKGPFVLTHGDLEAFNILVGDEGDIVGVLDWEWSRVVPRRYLAPPTWLKVNVDTLATAQGIYMVFEYGLRPLIDTMRTREMHKYGNSTLADEWDADKRDGGFIVARALESWTLMDHVAHGYIEKSLYNREGREERIQAFMDENPARKQFIEAKIRHGREYAAEMEHIAASKRDGRHALGPSLSWVLDRCKDVLGTTWPRFLWVGMAILCGTGAASIGLRHYAKWARRS